MFYLIHKACVLLTVFLRKIDEACYRRNIQNYCRVGTAHPNTVRLTKNPNFCSAQRLITTFASCEQCQL